MILRGVLRENEPISPKRTPIIEEYASVFQLPQGLPPQRPMDHRIVLNEGHPLVNTRPYKYAHS